MQIRVMMKRCLVALVMGLLLGGSAEAGSYTPAQYAQALCANIVASEPPSYKPFEHVLGCKPAPHQLFYVFIEVTHNGLGVVYRVLTHSDGRIVKTVVIASGPVA